MLLHWMTAIVVLVLLHAVIASDVVKPKDPSKKIRRRYSIRRPALLTRHPSEIDFPAFKEETIRSHLPGLDFGIQIPFQLPHLTGLEPIKLTDSSNIHHVQQQTDPAPEVTEAPASLDFTTPYLVPIGNAFYNEYSSSKGLYKSDSASGITSYPKNPSHHNRKYSYICPKVGGYHSQCRPATDCSVWYDTTLSTPGSACNMQDGHPGICCPDLPYNGNDGPIKKTKKKVKCEHQCIDIYSVNAAAHAGQFQLRLMDEIEKHLGTSKVIVRPKSAQYTHSLFFQSTLESQQLCRGALASIETTREMAKRFQLTADEAGFGLTQFNLKDTILADTCDPEFKCDEGTIASAFRTFDGSCNNIKHSSWGKSRTQYQRLLAPAYADGVWLPRRAHNGSKLPSPRLVSISVVLDQNTPSEAETTWVMQYGQFLAHDLAFTSFFRMNNSMSIQCCTEEGNLLQDKEIIHPVCLPIEIPEDDPFYSKFGQHCMSFVRSIPAPRSDCSLGHGEQMNGNTHFLDQSNVYGSDEKQSAAVRTFRNGTLKTTAQKGHRELDLLPPDELSETNCTLSKDISGVDPPAEVKCFKAGDSRSNQTPNLAVAHTIFMREHNRLAAELAYLNPSWNDERLFQEARRILIAQMQHITYNEWLPVVIGRAKMQQLGLLPLSSGYSEEYYKNLNPGILNEFASAAFRFGHTLVQGKQDLFNRRRNKEKHILLRQHFSKVQEVYKPGNLDQFLIGLATQPGQDFDNYFSKEVTHHLFEEEGKGFGLDLVSLNLQRGRDHGLPGYNAFRSMCGLPRAKHFNDLLDFISPAIVERFELLYDSVDDIDLYIGGISEDKAAGALLGPTFQCIVADQFLRLKRGDRFFYDLGRQSGSFTEEQLYQIRKISFARLVCDNSFVLYSQPLIFRLESIVNQVVDCDSSSIPRASLLPWKESQE